MARTDEYMDQAVTELQQDMQDMRGILYGDKRRNETTGLVQGLTQLAKLGDARDLRSARMEDTLIEVKDSLARLEETVKPVAQRVKETQETFISNLVGIVAVILWVSAIRTYIEVRLELAGVEPLTLFVGLLFTAGILTVVSLVLRIRADK